MYRPFQKNGGVRANEVIDGQASSRGGTSEANREDSRRSDQNTRTLKWRRAR